MRTKVNTQCLIDDCNIYHSKERLVILRVLNFISVTSLIAWRRYGYVSKYSEESEQLIVNLGL